MTGGAARQGESGSLAGHNRISTQALTSVARGAAAEIFDVAPADVRVSFADDGGLLALSVSLPIGIPPLTAVVRDPDRVAAHGGPIWSRAVHAKVAILDRVAALSGSGLSRVNIRITGVRATERSRVR
ncbi:hypothetical protein IV500_02185 [Paeniglutamicibacter antarcticus]|uniref:Uncharacterized protein n=1 Tax=Arthrobacter terrae TaxID=2935737 RepID=A0A931CLA6_9MICC|nr:hypothetical protein [Arthrobacter terrae]MBG0738245.1 hypothetical protein [Arthrobacter terrae]